MYKQTYKSTIYIYIYTLLSHRRANDSQPSPARTWARTAPGRRKPGCLRTGSEGQQATYIYIYIYICMYIHTCIYIYIYIHTHLSLSLYIYKHTSLSMCIYIYIYVCMYVCMHVCMYVCTYVRMYVCMYVYIYTYIYIYIYVYIYTYIYIFIHITCNLLRHNNIMWYDVTLYVQGEALVQHYLSNAGVHRELWWSSTRRNTHKTNEAVFDK